MFFLFVLILIVVGLAVALSVMKKQVRDDKTSKLDPIGGAEGKEIEVALEFGELNAFKNMLYNSWDNRDFYVSLFAAKIPLELIDTWIQSGEELALAHLVKGKHLIDKAFNDNRLTMVTNVSENVLLVFNELLENAREELYHSIELDPGDPTPWAFLIEIAHGLMEDKAIAQERFDWAISLDPENFSAHFNMFTYLTEKNCGSHKEMFAFARDTNMKTSHGNDLKVFIILGHIMKWQYFLYENNQRGAERYLREQNIKNECLRTYKNSVISPDFVKRTSSIYANNIYASWFYLIKDKLNLKTEIDIIGKANSKFPWSLIGNPDEMYTAAVTMVYGERF
jgi:tetratricopeptide (TPR) repeat protein